MARRLRLPRISARTGALIGVSAASVALFAVLVSLHATIYGTLLPLVFILGAAICAAPLLSLTRPLTAIAMFCGGAFALPLLVSASGGPAAPWPWSVPAMLAFVLFVGVVTFRHGARIGAYPLVIGMIGSLAVPLLRPDVHAGNAATANLIVTASVACGGYLIAMLAAGRLHVAQELSREREHSALEQSRRALMEERTRIARELHDVIAHSMSVIQVQASTARYRLPGIGAEATTEFESIAATARTSLMEMRRMLGVLRTEDQSAELAPQHDIEDIPGLVDSIRRAGVAVGLEITGATSTAPVAVQIAAYRIVQEGLSNAVRHSPGAPVAVRLQTDHGALRIRVSNPAARSEGPTGSGHGLRGMRERAELLGGSLTAGHQDDGSWSVIAELPLDLAQETP